MMGIDDILFRLGIDNRAFSNGLARAKQEVTGFSGALGKMGMAISAGMLMAAGRRLIEWGDRMKDASKNLGVSTDFLQKFNYALEMTSGSSEKSQQSLAKLNKIIGEAREGEENAEAVFKKYHIELKDAEGVYKSTEEMIGVIADKFKELVDPVARGQLGIKLFGRTGYEMAGAMSVGADGLKKLMDQASGRIISQEAFDSLDDLKKEMISLQGGIAGSLSTFFQLFSTAAQFYGEMSVRGIPKNLKEYSSWQAQNNQVKKALADAKILKERQEALAESKRIDESKWIEIEKEQAAQWEKDEEAWTRAKEKENALEEKSIALSERKLDLEKQLTDLQQRKAEAMGDRSRFSLGELAGLRSGAWTTPGMRGDIWGARQVTWLESQARRQAALGYFDRSQETLSMADKIRGGIGSLVGSDRDQFRSMRESMEETSADIKSLLAKASREGIRIIPVNGP